MPNAQNNETDTLRQQLADADKKRRKLLFALYLKHGGDTGAILEILFADAPAATLDRVEAMLQEADHA